MATRKTVLSFTAQYCNSCRDVSGQKRSLKANIISRSVLIGCGCFNTVTALLMFAVKPQLLENIFLVGVFTGNKRSHWNLYTTISRIHCGT